MRRYTTDATHHEGFSTNSNYHYMKITTEDNFIWKLVTQEQAEIIFASELFDLYELRDDDSESLIETFDEIKAIFENGDSVGIEVGFIKTDKL
jgi:replicative DNA helicase